MRSPMCAAGRGALSRLLVLRTDVTSQTAVVVFLLVALLSDSLAARTRWLLYMFSVVIRLIRLPASVSVMRRLARTIVQVAPLLHTYFGMRKRELCARAFVRVCAHRCAHGLTLALTLRSHVRASLVHLLCGWHGRDAAADGGCHCKSLASAAADRLLEARVHGVVVQRHRARLLPGLGPDAGQQLDGSVRPLLRAPSDEPCAVYMEGYAVVATEWSRIFFVTFWFFSEAVQMKCGGVAASCVTCTYNASRVRTPGSILIGVFLDMFAFRLKLEALDRQAEIRARQVRRLLSAGGAGAGAGEHGLPSSMPLTSIVVQASDGTAMATYVLATCARVRAHFSAR